MLPALVTLDHLVLTVNDLDTTVAFYRDILGLAAAQFTLAGGSTRWALKFGSQKIKLHAAWAGLPHGRNGRHLVDLPAQPRRQSDRNCHSPVETGGQFRNESPPLRDFCTQGLHPCA